MLSGYESEKFFVELQAKADAAWEKAFEVEKAGSEDDWEAAKLLGRAEGLERAVDLYRSFLEAAERM